MLLVTEVNFIVKSRIRKKNLLSFARAMSRRVQKGRILFFQSKACFGEESPAHLTVQELAVILGSHDSPVVAEDLNSIALCRRDIHYATQFIALRLNLSHLPEKDLPVKKKKKQ